MARYIDIDNAIPIMLKAVVDIVGHGITQVDAANIALMLEDASTADVVPKSEVARLVQENDDLKDSNEHLAVMLEETKIELEAMRGAANSYKMHYETAKSEAVKEFAEGLKTYYRNLDKSAGALIEYTIDQKLKEYAEISRQNGANGGRPKTTQETQANPKNLDIDIDIDIDTDLESE